MGAGGGWGGDDTYFGDRTRTPDDLLLPCPLLVVEYKEQCIHIKSFKECRRVKRDGRHFGVVRGRVERVCRMVHARSTVVVL